MTPKQQRFVSEYLIDLNATQAAIRAGYSERTANEQGARLLANVSVQAAIQAGQRDRSLRTEITADRVLHELSLLAFSDTGQILDFSGDEPKLRPANEIPETARRAISSFKVKRYVEGTGAAAKTVEVVEFKLWSKDAALAQLGKHLGITPDKIDLTVKGLKPAEMTEEQLYDRLAAIEAELAAASR